MPCPTRLPVAFLAGVLVAPAVERGEPAMAVATTTLSTRSDQIRQFAFDGDAATFFASQENPGASDHFTLVFDRPVSVTSVAVVTGKPGPTTSDKLDSGLLQVSSDGKTFTKLALFADGEARGDLHPGRVRAVRIQPTSGQAHPLAVREFTIASDPPVAIFRFPVEIEVDCSDSPEMTDWAKKAARLCERWYPRINDELKSERYNPPHYIKMKITKTYDGVAAASGDSIIGSTRYFKEHPDDVGAMIHEMTHIVQNYRRGGNPGWLVEGVADYIRFFLFEPGRIGPINPRDARYDASYRTTAAFLAYAARRYDQSLVSRLNTVMRAGKYTDEVFKELTGKTVHELDREWRQAIERRY